ncbi:MAG: hypothetical protein GY705_21240 [Bacteroidetes bacterium]|nr:hypothetical protein [Bacteroidota bacterium]
MKSLSQVIRFSLLFAMLFAFQSMVLAGNVEGTWIYKAADAPYEYSVGEITITKDAGKYKAVVAVNYSKLTVDKVTVDNNKVSFSLWIEDTKVDVTLNIDGKKMTGKAETYEGTIGLAGKKK